MTTELTVEQFRALEAATRGGLCDEAGWNTQAVATADTLEDFARAVDGYAESTVMQTGELAGYRFAAWRQVQVRRGDTRRSLSVLDLGDYRIALLGENLTDYV